MANGANQLRALLTRVTRVATTNGANGAAQQSHRLGARINNIETNNALPHTQQQMQSYEQMGTPVQQAAAQYHDITFAAENTRLMPEESSVADRPIMRALQGLNLNTLLTPKEEDDDDVDATSELEEAVAILDTTQQNTLLRDLRNEVIEITTKVDGLYDETKNLNTALNLLKEDLKESNRWGKVAITEEIEKVRAQIENIRTEITQTEEKCNSALEQLSILDTAIERAEVTRQEMQEIERNMQEMQNYLDESQEIGRLNTQAVHSRAEQEQVRLEKLNELLERYEQELSAAIDASIVSYNNQLEQERNILRQNRIDPQSFDNEMLLDVVQQDQKLNTIIQKETSQDNNSQNAFLSTYNGSLEERSALERAIKESLKDVNFTPAQQAQNRLIFEQQLDPRIPLQSLTDLNPVDRMAVPNLEHHLLEDEEDDGMDAYDQYINPNGQRKN